MRGFADAKRVGIARRASAVRLKAILKGTRMSVCLED